MKKFFVVFINFVILLASLTTYASTTITINGVNAEIPPDMGSVKIEENRTFVPVRFLLEHLDYDVSWDGEDMVVFGKNTFDGIFVMQVGNNILTYSDDSENLKTTQMDVSPFLDSAEGRTYIPLRFLAEAIGYNVDYNEATQTVILNKK